MCRFSIKFVDLTRTVNSCVQVLTGAQRRVKTEAVATCVCLHLRSINTPLNTPVCVRRDRSWLLTAYAADLVSQNTTVVKRIYTFYFWNFIEPKAEKWTQDINWQWHISIIIWMPYFQPILEHQQHQHPPISNISAICYVQSFVKQEAAIWSACRHGLQIAFVMIVMAPELVEMSHRMESCMTVGPLNCFNIDSFLYSLMLILLHWYEDLLCHSKPH